MAPLSVTRNQIPKPVAELMEEVYKALQSDSPRLAAMGIRASLELVMTTTIGDRGSFRENLDAFQQAGYLSLRQVHVVQAILEPGHASIHRGWTPTSDDISTLMDITESVIESTFLHEYRAKNLEGKIPPRLTRRNADRS